MWLSKYLMIVHRPRISLAQGVSSSWDSISTCSDEGTVRGSSPTNWQEWRSRCHALGTNRCSRPSIPWNITQKGRRKGEVWIGNIVVEDEAYCKIICKYHNQNFVVHILTETSLNSPQIEGPTEQNKKIRRHRGASQNVNLNLFHRQTRTFLLTAIPRRPPKLYSTHKKARSNCSMKSLH